MDSTHYESGANAMTASHRAVGSLLGALFVLAVALAPQET
jgi:hypothetical protein